MSTGPNIVLCARIIAEWSSVREKLFCAFSSSTLSIFTPLQLSIGFFA